VSLDGRHQNTLFQETSLANQVIHLIPVRDAGNVLFENGTFVEIGRGVVRRRSNQLWLPCKQQQQQQQQQQGKKKQG
jgi:hypothetical protein